MCGRYCTATRDTEAWRGLYSALACTCPDYTPREGEIFPSDTVPILLMREGVWQAVPGTWGLPSMFGRKKIINVRAESVPEKKMFADSFTRRRCAVPTVGYYEWSPDHRRHLLGETESILYLAGIYENTPDGVHFAILTRPAPPETALIHPRAPLTLPGGTLRRYCTDTEFAGQYLRQQTGDGLPSV